MKPLTIILLTLLFVGTLTALAMAQPGLPSDPQQAPLGGLEFLALLRVGYAIKKLREENNAR